MSSSVILAPMASSKQAVKQEGGRVARTFFLKGWRRIHLRRLDALPERLDPEIRNVTPHKIALRLVRDGLWGQDSNLRWPQVEEPNTRELQLTFDA